MTIPQPGDHAGKLQKSNRFSIQNTQDLMEKEMFKRFCMD